jgi:hypothetical protein
MMKSEAMNTKTKFGIAMMVLALLVFQPFSNCFATPVIASAHDCCPARIQAECTMASCACKSTDSATAPIPASTETGQPFAALVAANPQEFAVPVHRFAEPEAFHLPLNDRFVVLHQLLI